MNNLSYIDKTAAWLRLNTEDSRLAKIPLKVAV
jgi:hypothetical protein